jgi:hypothetical protein
MKSSLHTVRQFGKRSARTPYRFLFLIIAPSTEPTPLNGERPTTSEKRPSGFSALCNARDACSDLRRDLVSVTFCLLQLLVSPARLLRGKYVLDLQEGNREVAGHWLGASCGRAFLFVIYPLHISKPSSSHYASFFLTQRLCLAAMVGGG